MTERHRQQWSPARPRGSAGALRVLVIGSMPPPLGGTAISLRYLVEGLRQRDDVSVRVIDTSGIRGRALAGVFRLARVMADIFRSARAADVVSLHVCTPALPMLGLWTLAAARAARRSLIVRKFAGLDYRDLGALRGLLAHWVVKSADLYLAQTRRLVELAHERGIDHVRLYPTSRPLLDAAPAAQADDGGGAGRYVYVGQVRPIKGMGELMAAAADLAGRVHVDVFGPLLEGMTADDFHNCPAVTYKGVLAPEEVIDTVGRYDALILPTKAASEGYPGAILEAYAAGVAVIATTCGAIGEIVDDSTGLLVTPGDVDALRAAMMRLADDQKLLMRQRQGARRRGEDFSCRVWVGRFVQYCLELAPRRGGSARQGD